VAGVKRALLSPAAALYGWAWERRRDAYARGWRTPERVGARVVSVGNLTVGGAGKTTLTLHLAAVARARGVHAAVVSRRYRPGPGGRGDEELLFRAALGEPWAFAGANKRELARAAAAAGASLVFVDDGFSHWALERDLDLVLLDRTDLWGGGRMLPAGRLREPRRALQRAGVVVISRMGREEDPEPWLEEIRAFAPAAHVAAGRHRIVGVLASDGSAVRAEGPAHVVTATGNAEAVAASAREAGFGPVSLSAWRDHHWWTVAEAGREAERAGRSALLVTAKDAVRWPAAAPRRPSVLQVEWAWVAGGDEVERRVFAGGA
jgi:tetraacyldisaccharide 4'-kinase